MPVPVNKKIKCMLCNEWSEDLVSIANHLKSDDHQKKTMENSEKMNTAHQGKCVSPKNLVLVNALYCELCDVKTTGVERMVSHYKSKKHSKNLRYHADEKKDIDRKDFQKRQVILLKEIELKKCGIFKCSMCTIVFETKRSFKKHLRSENHHQRINIIRSITKQENHLMFPKHYSIINI
ncbi:hypothetical protein JTE90_009405 [Oedothorax gibbosus]|uniref:C2H2-type domain-containing protein n=1 Tax=Oedothorax gibbosus TaxID=931172 RepID=A0AAV6VU27_9ARAC|nr:hypothetical protein JTE90_009405 [Oedothorax gibbosus]